MSRGLRLVWVTLGALSLALLVALFLLPAEWEIERSRRLAAPREEIFPLLVDLRAWDRWSPWREGDYAGLAFVYEGPATGVGASRTWSSEETGDGALEIVAAEPPRRLAFTTRYQQGRISARDEIALAPLPEGGTLVTWSERGSLGRTLLGRLSLPVIEEAMGRDIERALEGLAAASEVQGVPR